VRSFSRYPLFQPRLKHATAGLAAAVCAWVDLAAAVACAWAVLLARALVPLVSVAPAWASPALGEWVSLVEE